jgi:hypothetical protein
MIPNDTQNDGFKFANNRTYCATEPAIVKRYEYTFVQQSLTIRQYLDCYKRTFYS